MSVRTTTDTSVFAIRHGMTRLVLCVGPLAIKVPRWNGVHWWLYGLMANVDEWQRWKIWRHPQLARVYWSGFGGLVLFAKRYRERVVSIDKSDYRQLPFVTDWKASNVTVEDGRLVLLDYGEPGWEPLEATA